MTRKKTGLRPRKAQKSVSRKTELTTPSDPVAGQVEKPIVAFSENVGASWPTPDNLGNPIAVDRRTGPGGGEGQARDPKTKVPYR
jgi:hypothetical protein